MQQSSLPICQANAYKIVQYINTQMAATTKEFGSVTNEIHVVTMNVCEYGISPQFALVFDLHAVSH